MASAVPNARGSTLKPSAVVVSRATAVAARLRPSAAMSRGISEPAAAYGVAVMSWVGSDPRSSPASLATAQAANGVTASQVSVAAGAPTALAANRGDNRAADGTVRRNLHMPPFGTMRYSRGL